MSSLTNFITLLALADDPSPKLHHATSLTTLLIAFAYCFKFFSPCSNLDHIEYRIRLGPGRVAFDIFLCVTIPFVQFVSLFWSHRCTN
jgi:hypothetical protein